MKRFNITIPKKYTKDGEEKTAWNNVGTLVYFPATQEKQEGFILELNMFPDTPFKVFEQKDRDSKPKNTVEPTKPGYLNKNEPDPEEDINPSDIPF